MRFSIFPFKHCGQWVFSDAAVGVHYEPFVRGADELIDDLVLELYAPERGFRLNFSSLPFAGWTMELAREQLEGGGAWYVDCSSGIEGWLCAVLVRYWPKPPEWIYASAEDLPESVMHPSCKATNRLGTRINTGSAYGIRTRRANANRSASAATFPSRPRILQ